jgi:serine/threonine-protein kinase
MPTVISSDLPIVPSIFDHAVHPRELGRLLEGERLGHFDLEKFVGGGGMGAVFRATDTMLGRIVAVKVLSQDQASEDDTLLRFKNEAQSAARLDHENIARVYYVGEDRGLNYIVFEFIEGENIRDLVDRRGGLPLGEAISYTLQIAEALDHASQRDVVHRDIKPSNVLITSEGHAKLVDMGLARLHQVEHSGDDLTASGVTLGTFDYISPEQARDPRMADVRSDLYSLGCTLYFMLTGKPPFPEGTVLQKLLQHQGDEPPDPREVRPDLPQEVTRLLSKMLVKSPDARYQQPSELIADLLLLADRLGIHHVIKPGKVWVAEPRSRWAVLQQHAPWMVPVASLLAVVLLMDYLGSPSAPLASTPNDGGMPLVREQFDEGKSLAPTKTEGAAPRDDSPKVKTPSDRKTGSTQPAKDPPTPATDVASDPAENIATSSHPLHKLLTRAKADGATLDVSDDTGVSAALDVASDDASALTEADHTASVDLSDGATSAVHPTQRTLIVDGAGGEEGRYATLGAAINEAKSGDSIELHFNQPAKVEQPILIDNKDLTIRAGNDPQRDGELFRPVIVFRPTQVDVSDPGKSHFAMITLRGGKVQLNGIHIQMDLDSELVAERWSMFQIHGVEHFQLADCSLTIRNSPDKAPGSHHSDVSFFDVLATAGGGEMMPDGTQPQKIIPIELNRCIARGEAVFLSAREPQPLKLWWKDGFLATTEQLLVAGSGQKKSISGGFIQVDLDHVTAVTQGGLYLSANDRDEPHQLAAKFKVVDCILIGEAARYSLVQQVGIDETKRDFEMRLDWEGHGNVYQEFDFEAFWLIRSGEGTDAEELGRLSFSDWRGKWGELAESTAIVWKSPPDPNQAIHSLTAADYEIDVNAPNNPTLGAGGEHSGFDPRLLPKLPQTVIFPKADEPTSPDKRPADDDALSPSTD